VGLLESLRAELGQPLPSDHHLSNNALEGASS
jgi:hypothetical protein